MADVKGTTIAGRRQYVLRHHGEAKLRAVLEALKDRNAARQLEMGVMKSAWYPFSLYVDLTEAIDRVAGRGDGSLYRSIGAQTAEDDISTVYKVFFKLLQPVYIIQKAAQLWSVYYNSGHLKVAQPSPETIDFEIVDFDSPHWAHCESVLGWAQRSIQMTGAKNVRADHVQCRGKGANHCRMRIHWDK